MITYPIRSNYTYLGYPNPSWQDAKVALLPIPYDATTSYQSGSRFGPEAMMNASAQLELYDEELAFETVQRVPIYTLDQMAPQLGNPADMVAEVYKATKQIYRDKKFPFCFGGEHSLTFGAVKAACEQYDNVSVLHFDAHADFRNEYEGTPYNHACVMRRSIECADNVTSVGVRSVSIEDATEHKHFTKRHQVFLAPALPTKKILATLKKNVYITIDVDVFDAAVMPATGTPQPGGLGWYDVLGLVRAVAKSRTVIGADVMEFMPIGGLRAPDFLAAKLVYKMIGSFYFPHKLK
jgi:agmatinase